MKKILKTLFAYLPAPWASWLKATYRNTRDKHLLNHAYQYDMRFYKSHSGLLSQTNKGVVEAEIIKAYHRIEKGLALASPRPGFGVDAVELVLERTQYYVDHFGPNVTTQRAVNTLREYVQFNQAHHCDVSWLVPRLNRLAEKCIGVDSAGGTRRVTRDQITRAIDIDYAAFVNQRYSIRQFTPEPVSDDAIAHAVTLAKKSPSVCNRESGCVFVASSSAQKRALLSLQNGNRGFGEQADRILVITSRLDTFLTVGERYQCWIDGGLFAMSLIYALHAQGVGSCCLNWSVEPDADTAIRQVAGIPQDHAVIMLLAIGHIPSDLLIAQSPRRPLEDVLHFI